ncbi:uncharacterized protein LOC115402532 isoform X2 [Salarias fasciatus]|nr:uncharacterized protein LOC115402532 isoform X2 [Salarias fasciatus]
MYGPYYPNYNKGEHSEDTIIRQTQELLETEGDPEDWKVYIFTMNSPCLARNTDPCMLKLVHKAQEWWRLYGVKTHIGFVRCWGFKGNKENVFKDISYQQVECINQSEDFKSYVQTAEKALTDADPLCEAVFCVAKRLLKSEPVKEFPLTTTVQKQDRKSYCKSMHTKFESKPEDERKVLTQEVRRVTEAAEVLLSDQTGSLEEYLERGSRFILGHSFASQVCGTLQDEMRLAFQQCWTEMVQDMYAEFIREKLTEDFNHCTIQLFIQDILKITAECLQIGKVELSEEDPNAFRF